MVRAVILCSLTALGLLAGGLYWRWRQSTPPDRTGQQHLLQDIQDARLRLFILGDSGSGLPYQHTVAQAMEDMCQKSPPNALIFLGDNFYTSGVKSTEDPLWQERMIDIYSSACLSQVPIYPVLGNHDYGLDPGAQIRMTKSWSRWRFPHRFYQVTFGRIATITLYDSHIFDFCLNSDVCSGDFLMQSKASPGVAWHILAAHHPIRSRSAKSFGHRGGLKPWLLEPWLCRLADVTLSGHSHHLEYQKAPCGIHHFISGGGGAELNGIKDGPGYAISTHGFLVMEMTASKAKGQFIQKDGAVLKVIELEKLPGAAKGD